MFLLGVKTYSVHSSYRTRLVSSWSMYW